MLVKGIPDHYRDGPVHGKAYIQFHAYLYNYGYLSAFLVVWRMTESRTGSTYKVTAEWRVCVFWYTRVSHQRGINTPFKCTGNHTCWGLKNNWGIQSKNGLESCEGIPCSSFSVKELDVIVHKRYFYCITMLNFDHSVPHITSEPGGWGGN